MMQRITRESLFQSSQLMILVSYTIFSVILIGETLLMSWETWPLIPIVISIVTAWVLHMQQRFSDSARLWIYTGFILFAFLFYGSHRTSLFDIISVMSVMMLLYTSTGIKPLITILLVAYYITFGNGLLTAWHDGETFDTLMISRILLHITIITTISIISHMTMNRWASVLDSTQDEIEQLTDATGRLNDFLANVSHETRTPINAIIGLSSLCIDEETNAEKCANLISVREAGRRVADQISDILDFTEIDRKKLTNNYEDYMLSSVLNDLVEEIRPFKPKELELVIDVDPAIPSVMNTDISKLRKILRHLIINGLRYTREGGVYVRLYAIKEDYGVNLVIRVTDTGIGMTEEELERVYERYYQADSGRSRQGGGLGLGMTIVSGFTASLGGFMTISSKPGVGTSVSVSLPQKVIEPDSCMSISRPDQLCLGAFLHLDKYPDPNVREYYNMMIRNIVKGFGVQMHRVDNAANLKKLLGSVRLTHLFVSEEEYDAAAEMIEEAAEKMIVVVVANHDFRLPEGSHARIMEKPFYCFPVAAVLNADYSSPVPDDTLFCAGVRALAVDDEPMNLVVAKNILKRYGISVTTAGSGAEALEICREQRFDIIFMDHMMPGMDGVETMKRIRAGESKGSSDTPIIALTANAVSTAREMFMSAGFDGFVSKPIELVELERVLRKVLPKSVIQPLSEKPQQTDSVQKEQVQKQPEQTAAAEEKQEPSVMERLAGIGLDTEEGIRYCANDAEFYLTMLMQFADETEEKLGNMQTFLREDDLVNYEILVHALKNTLKMIGSDALSERAKAMEFAAKDEKRADIDASHPALDADCRVLIAGIRGILGKEDTAQQEQEDLVMTFLPEEAETDGVIEFIPSDGEEENRENT